jgi:hypothetical protein
MLSALSFIHCPQAYLPTCLLQMNINTITMFCYEKPSRIVQSKSFLEPPHAHAMHIHIYSLLQININTMNMLCYENKPSRIVQSKSFLEPPHAHAMHIHISFNTFRYLSVGLLYMQSSYLQINLSFNHRYIGPPSSCPQACVT